MSSLVALLTTSAAQYGEVNSAAAVAAAGRHSSLLFGLSAV